MRSGKKLPDKTDKFGNVVGNAPKNETNEYQEHFKTAVRRFGFFLGGFLLGKLTSFLIRLL